MSAILLWVRSVLRKHIAGTLAIALLGGLAAGVVGVAVHAARPVVRVLQRHAHDLAVFAALGLTRRQRLGVGIVSGSALTGLSGLTGTPGGIVLVRWVWRVVEWPAGVSSGPITAWPPTLLAPLCAMTAGAVAASLSGRSLTRGSQTPRLRVE